MKQGFTLLEVLVATALSLAIMTLLINVVRQINRSAGMLDNQISIYSTAVIGLDQLERDISGAFIPFRAQKKDEPKNEAAAAQAPGAKKPEPAKGEKKEKPLTHVFYATNKESNLDTLTFITNNPLQGYWSGNSGTAKPLVARVIYTLVPEKNISAQKSSFALMRKEVTALDYTPGQEDKEPTKNYELMDHVKSLTLKYVARVEKKEEKKSQTSTPTSITKTTETKKSYEYKTFDTWDQEGKEKKEGKMRAVPHAVEITLTVWNLERTKDQEFKLIVPIIPELEFMPEPVTKPTPAAEQPKPGAPAAPVTANGQRVAVTMPAPSEEPRVPLARRVDVQIPPTGRTA
jgi:prepilin-type N-terminal cleavage/methylation domain-containing protein